MYKLESHHSLCRESILVPHAEEIGPFLNMILGQQICHFLAFKTGFNVFEAWKFKYRASIVTKIVFVSVVCKKVVGSLAIFTAFTQETVTYAKNFNATKQHMYISLKNNLATPLRSPVYFGLCIGLYDTCFNI